MSDYRWCGLNEQYHALEICGNIRLQDKKTKEWSRSRCGFLNEAGSCDFLTPEEKMARDKATKGPKNKEVKESEKKNNGDTDSSPGESSDQRD